MSTPTDPGPSDVAGRTVPPDEDRWDGADAGGTARPVDDEDQEERSARPVTDDDYDELGAGD